ATLRARAGLALGTLCYGVLSSLISPGATTPLTDPRLLDLQMGNATDEGYWRDVDAGSFWYGNDRETKPLQQVELPYAFRIARYPITNAEYAQFVAASGYRERRWWTEEGWKYCEAREWSEQRLLHNPQYNNPLQPVVGISWYEAT